MTIDDAKDRVPYRADAWIDGRIARSKERILQESPVRRLGKTFLRDIANTLEDWRNDDSLPPVTPFRLAIRLRGLAAMGADMIAGWSQEPASGRLRDFERRRDVMTELESIRSLLMRAQEKSATSLLTEYLGGRALTLERQIDHVGSVIEYVKAERPGTDISSAIALPFNVLREVGEGLCGRSLRNVDRVSGEELGPLFEFCFGAITRLAPDLPEDRVVSAIGSLSRRRRS